MTVSSFLKGKLKIVARCVSAGSGTLTLTVSKAEARRIGLKGTKLGSANATCDGHGRFTVKVKPNEPRRRRSGDWRGSVKVTATLALAGPIGQTTATRTIKLKGKGRARWTANGRSPAAEHSRAASGASPWSARSTSTSARAERQEDVGVRALGVLDAVRPVPARPAAAAGGDADRRRTKQLEQYVITMKPGNGRHPARARDAGARLQRALPGADDPGHARARGADPPDQPERARPQRAPARRRDRAAVRRASARRDPHRRRAAVQVPERRPLGDALVPRPRARRDGPDAVRRAGRVLHPRRQGRRARWICRRASTTSR